VEGQAPKKKKKKKKKKKNKNQKKKKKKKTNNLKITNYNPTKQNRKPKLDLKPTQNINQLRRLRKSRRNESA